MYNLRRAGHGGVVGVAILLLSSSALATCLGASCDKCAHAFFYGDATNQVTALSAGYNILIYSNGSLNEDTTWDVGGHWAVPASSSRIEAIWTGGRSGVFSFTFGGTIDQNTTAGAAKFTFGVEQGAEGVDVADALTAFEVEQQMTNAVKSFVLIKGTDTLTNGSSLAPLMDGVDSTNADTYAWWLEIREIGCARE